MAYTTLNKMVTVFMNNKYNNITTYFYASYISCSNSEKVIKIGVYLRTLSQKMKPGYRFLDHPVHCIINVSGLMVLLFNKFD